MYILDSNLNEEQKRAVYSDSRALLIVAGAGTGKTRVLTTRAARLLKENPEERYLLLTFTKKAAMEMTTRVRELIEEDTKNRLYSGTFHSFCSNIIRRRASKVDLSSDFVIIDESDSMDLMKKTFSKIYSKEALDSLIFKPKDILSIYSYSRNNNQDFIENIQRRYKYVNFEDIKKIISMYELNKKERNYLDFDDLLMYGLLAIKTLDESPFDEVLVDEFQDTNQIQAEMLYHFYDLGSRVSAVGDDAQSIYSFRGAYYENMSNLVRRLDAEKIILSSNYRSTQPILNIANSVIQSSYNSIKKELIANVALKKNIKPQLVIVADDWEESRYVARQMQKFKEEGLRVAALYRAAYIGRNLESQLNSMGIGYSFYGGQKLTESAHAKDFMSFLRVFMNVKDEIALIRVLRMFPGVGEKKAEKIKDAVISGGNLNTLLAKEKNLAELNIFFDKLAEITDWHNVLEVVFEFYKDIMKRLYPENYEDREIDLIKFMDMSSNYDNLVEYLEAFTLDPVDKSEFGNSDVILSTVHSAKGLEFDVVFLLSVIESVYPHFRAQSTDEIEEERRLFYVAITRAKQRLIFTFPRHSKKNKGYFAKNTISPFLKEQDNYLEVSIAR